MNEAQRNIIALLMRCYGNFTWSQPGDYGDSVTVCSYLTVEENYDELMRIVSNATCVVVEFHWLPNPNRVESFSFECRYPTNHYYHRGIRYWQSGSDNQIIPYETGEIADLGRAFADAFGLPIRYHEQEGNQ